MRATTASRFRCECGAKCFGLLVGCSQAARRLLSRHPRESCSGKSTLAKALSEIFGFGQVFTQTVQDVPAPDLANIAQNCCSTMSTVMHSFWTEHCFKQTARHTLEPYLHVWSGVWLPSRLLHQWKSLVRGGELEAVGAAAGETARRHRQAVAPASAFVNLYLNFKPYTQP